VQLTEELGVAEHTFAAAVVAAVPGVSRPPFDLLAPAQVAQEYGLEQSDLLKLNPDLRISKEGAYQEQILRVPCKGRESE
jgi:hypothetical protein